MIAGALHASTGDSDAARMAFEHAIAVAEPIGANDIVRRARERLAAMDARR
jgi:hypothetical protein